MDYLCSSSPKKIAAIKLLRSECKAGLKEAKESIERLEYEKFGKNYPHVVKTAAAIHVGPAIKKVIVDFGDGDITVDLEEMQMKVLMDMPVIGLDVGFRMYASGDALRTTQRRRARLGLRPPRSADSALPRTTVSPGLTGTSGDE